MNNDVTFAMKEEELRANSTCSTCGRPVMHTGLPLFWKVKVVRYGIDVGAVRRFAALATLLGGSEQLASAMGPDEDMAVPVSTEVTLVLCERCMDTHTGYMNGQAFGKEDA